MGKEFTDTEIAQMNKEFDTANAFTKWKFMQTPEFKELPDAVRYTCLLYTSPSPRDLSTSRMPSSA